MGDLDVSGNWPADAVERRSLKTLVPYAKNARTHSASQIDQIAASIREWGFTMPVLVDVSNTVIAGHGRILAAEKLGLDTVPVMVAKGWTQRQIKAYRLADNQLALNAAWDVNLLATELGSLGDSGFDIGLLAFPEYLLSELMADPSFEPVSIDDQGRLDRKRSIHVICPNCAHEFEA